MNDDGRFEGMVEVDATADNIGLLLAAAQTLSVDPVLVRITSYTVVLAPSAVVDEAGLGMVPA